MAKIRLNRDPNIRADISPKSVNEAMRDRIVRHQMLLQEVGDEEARKIVALLDEAEADLLDQLHRRLGKVADRGYDLGPRTTRRVAELQQSFGKIVDSWKSKAYGVNRDDMVELAHDEIDFQKDLFDKTLPPQLNVEMVLPDPGQLRSIVTTEPFDGTPLSKWYGKMATGLKTRLDGAVRMGMVEGQTIDQIARRIRGTRANGFKDGIIEANRREARAIARTAVNHTSNRTREKLYEENADVVKGVQWVATLDARTCFSAGTKVLTREGERPIEEIEEGMEVFTHRGRWRKVSEIHRREYLGEIWTTRSEGRTVSSTPDHLFFTKEGWRELSQIGEPDRVLRLSQEGRYFSGHSSRMASVETVVADPGNLEALSIHKDVAAGVPIFHLVVPINRIHLKDKVVFGKEEVGGIAADFELLNEVQSQSPKTQSHIRFGDGFPGEFPVASETAKTALPSFSGADPEGLPAGKTIHSDNGAAALFRAIAAILSGAGIENFPASLAGDLGSVPTGAGANGVSCRIGGGDTELLPTGFADFSDPVDSGSEITGAVAILSGFFPNRGREIDPATFTSSGRDLPLDLFSIRIVTRSGAETALRSAEVSGLSIGGFSAKSTSDFHSSNIEIISKVVKDNPVYNIEVLDDHSYIAEGFVVHNCPECMALDGRVFKLDNVKRRPPAHVACRCTLVPVLRSFREMGFKAKEAAPGTRESMNGKVSAKVTYPEWLKGQPKWVQNRALGKKRAELWRQGKVDIKQFTNESGRKLTLEQLKKVEKRNAAPKTPPKKAPSAPKPRAPKATIVVEEVRPVSDSFRQKVDAAIDPISRNIPAKIQDRINKIGGRVRIGDLLTEVRPDLKGKTPRGWGDGDTWDMAEGLFDSRDKSAVIVEHHKFGNVLMDTSPQRISGGVPHEYGHMVDEFGKAPGDFDFSTRKKFKDAWGKDLKEMNVEDSIELDYFTGNVSADAARSEAFAEGFAIQYTGTGAAHWNVDLFKKRFKNTLRVIVEMLEE